MILFEKKYQTFDTVFHHQMKHLEVRQKYSAARRISNSLLGVSSGDETLHLIFDILHELYEAILFQFPDNFSLPYEKKLSKVSLNECKATQEARAVQAPVKRGETWRNSRTARAFDWTDQFSRMWKTSFTIFIVLILFHLCEKHCPLL